MAASASPEERHYRQAEITKGQQQVTNAVMLATACPKMYAGGADNLGISDR